MERDAQAGFGCGQGAIERHSDEMPLQIRSPLGYAVQLLFQVNEPISEFRLYTRASQLLRGL